VHEEGVGRRSLVWGYHSRSRNQAPVSCHLYRKFDPQTWDQRPEQVGDHSDSNFAQWEIDERSALES